MAKGNGKDGYPGCGARPSALPGRDFVPPEMVVKSKGGALQFFLLIIQV